ncbi:ADP-glyceromanno-heptose 6-epimerase [Duganella zoogloeoides]|uniref:ADP-L-glycero-D-manno-heptose-6-epimerase n=1 Tax=Duganella zoogloeoides TaxID=75659 RepID=A0ABZ0Y7L9_9BURK|nr:ADP-glyceromanno-heptose 6-epimerase [Duganella zoogloeoides]WQH07457.1 ADP-glyceromanno-heptose 6-epimerase [Duganella zoogloeoides]
MMILVTGGAGFIGSNIVHALSQRGEATFVVDNLKRPEKFHNVVDAEVVDYMGKEEFIERLERGEFAGKFSAVFHEGACSDTMEMDGEYMMRNNFRYSVSLFHFCQKEKIPFIYASSAAVYGAEEGFTEERSGERPLNVYGYSKFLFDQYVRNYWKTNGDRGAQVVGLRYFNVYGPREFHKGNMASVPLHQYRQFLADGQVKLFGEYDGYAAGTQTRDFVYIDDVVSVNLFFLDNPDKSGIFNLGTGRAQPFNDIAVAVVNNLKPEAGALALDAIVEQKLLEYVAFPDKLKGKYQSFTQANIAKLRAIGYDKPFYDVSAGVTAYIAWLKANHK